MFDMCYLTVYTNRVTNGIHYHRTEIKSVNRGCLKIQSIVKGMTILELFNKYRRELSIAEISRYTKLPKSTVHGIVSTLLILGYLQQNEENDKYTLGLKIIGLSTTLLKMTNIYEISRPYLYKLANKIKETVQLAILQEGEVFYIAKVQLSQPRISINSEVGFKLPAYCTGLGKAILAYMSKNEIENIYKNRPFIKYTKNTITRMDQLLQELTNIKKTSIAYDNEEFAEGLSCIATPIFNYKKVIAAVSISGSTSIIINNKKEFFDAIKQTAMQISEKLGGGDRFQENAK